MNQWQALKMLVERSELDVVMIAGRWTLRAELLVTDFDKLTVEDTVVLPHLP